MEFTIRVANRYILIHSVYSRVYELCKPYLAEGNVIPDIEIRITDDLINEEAERIISTSVKVTDIRNTEWMLLHRMISEALLAYDTMLMHGAVIAVDNKAYMFTAKSGTGKTTHIQSWLTNNDSAYVVNGDKPYIIIPKTDECPMVCGSPWAGKEKMQTNTIVPLKAIVLMERADENRIERVSLVQILPDLLQQVYQPESREKMRQILTLIQRLSKNVSFWRFHFNNFKDDCFAVSYNALVKGENE
ncbi:hypothetical protein JS518_03755 [Clostridiales bacterium FE2010]|nr:hypothetical protein JS518_03755 [Clostridiales bacterium FE2010]